MGSILTSPMRQAANLCVAERSSLLSALSLLSASPLCPLHSPLLSALSSLLSPICSLLSALSSLGGGGRRSTHISNVCCHSASRPPSLCTLERYLTPRCSILTNGSCFDKMWVSYKLAALCTERSVTHTCQSRRDLDR